MIASISLPVGVSSACSVMETTLMPFLRSMDLKTMACSRLRVKRENFHTRMTSKGALVLPPSSIMRRNCGRSATRPLSASSMNSRTITQLFFCA